MSLRDNRAKVTTKKIAAVVDEEWIEEEVPVDEDIEEDLENADLEQVRRLLYKYRANAKGARKGTFIYTKIKKLEKLEKELESKQ